MYVFDGTHFIHRKKMHGLPFFDFKIKVGNSQYGFIIDFQTFNFFACTFEPPIVVRPRGKKSLFFDFTRVIKFQFQFVRRCCPEIFFLHLRSSFRFVSKDNDIKQKKVSLQRETPLGISKHKNVKEKNCTFKQP